MAAWTSCLCRTRRSSRCRSVCRWHDTDAVGSASSSFTIVWAYRHVHALDVNIDAILPPPQPPQPIDPATENANAVKGMPLQAFPDQDTKADHDTCHVLVFAGWRRQPAGVHAAVTRSGAHWYAGTGSGHGVLPKAAKQAMAAGEPVPQIAPDLVESTVAQQTSQIMREIMPMLQPAQQQDPLVASASRNWRTRRWKFSARWQTTRWTSRWIRPSCNRLTNWHSSVRLYSRRLLKYETMSTYTASIQAALARNK